jgi:hypothetical protein
MANVTVTTAAVQIEEVWSPELNRAVQYDLVIAALFQDRSADLRTGDTLHLPSRHNLTANTKSAGTALTPEAITETEQTFQVTTQKATAQRIEDIAEIQSRYDLRAESTMAGSYALSRAIDSDAGALFANNTTQTVGTLGAELSDDNLIRAWQYLKDSAAPSPQHIVVAPATYGGFLKTEKFVNQLYTGDQGGSAVAQAKVGNLYGADVYVSQLTSGTAPSSSGCWFSEGHYIKVIQRPPSVHLDYSPLDLAWIAVMDVIYGVFERLEADEAAAATTNSRLWSVRLQSVK